MKLCCEDFEGLVEAGYIYLHNNKPTMYLAIFEHTIFQDGLEVSFTHCPFCGEEVKG